MLQVFAHKEVGVGKARAQDMLIALADKVNTEIVAVADGNEVGKKTLTIPSPSGRGDGSNGEVALMLLHDRDQDFTRQLQKFFIEAAHHCGGHFNQVCYFR